MESLNSKLKATYYDEIYIETLLYVSVKLTRCTKLTIIVMVWTGYYELHVTWH